VPDSVKDLKSFFAWAKANPDKAAYGSPGAGSMPHLIGVLVAKASGSELRHVGYRGSAPGIQDLLGGQIAAFFGPTGDVITHSKAGKVRVLGTSGGERNAFLPDVPTLREQGVSVALREWYAFFMPAKASGDAVQRAAAALRPVLGDREVVEFARTFGLEAQASGPRDLAELLKRDSAEWGGLVRQTGFTADS
jgi:tripartite-type tricarboxylate transporter receptor subunit TctC